MLGSPPAEEIGQAWRRASRRIARLDARLLIEQVAGCTHSDLIAHPERKLTGEQALRFDELVTRREAGEPLAYLLGSTFFWGLEFAVSPAVLIPRPDTEVLVRQAMHLAAAWPAPRIADLGTGSGIVAIVLARELPAAQVTAIDLSPTALEVARGNAQRHAASVRFMVGDWFSPLPDDERFELIVSNPPYVAAGDPHLLGDGLPFEPRQALTDGISEGDGMDCIRTLINEAPGHLATNAWLLIEHGYDQAVQTRSLLQGAGFRDVRSWLDDADIERVSGGQWLAASAPRGA